MPVYQKERKVNNAHEIKKSTPRGLHGFPTLRIYMPMLMFMSKSVFMSMYALRGQGKLMLDQEQRNALHFSIRSRRR